LFRSVLLPLQEQQVQQLYPLALLALDQVQEALQNLLHYGPLQAIQPSRVDSVQD
jgi:hypothetical protein